MPEVKDSIAVLLAEHERLKILFLEALEKEHCAKTVSLNACNAINGVQRKIDEAIADVRKLSPHKSGWNGYTTSKPRTAGG